MIEGFLKLLEWGKTILEAIQEPFRRAWRKLRNLEALEENAQLKKEIAGYKAKIADPTKLFPPGTFHSERTGTWADPDGIHYCHSCFFLKKEPSKLKREEVDEQVFGWKCMVKGCEQFYRNPDYIDPPEPERPKSYMGY